MNKKRVLGILLIILAGLIALSNITITGAVIGSSVADFISFLTIGLFAVGVFLLEYSNRPRIGMTLDLLVQKTLARDPLTRKRMEKDEKPFLVLDTNFLMKEFPSNKGRREYIQKKIKQGYHIIVPDALEKELNIYKDSKDKKEIYNFSAYSGYNDLRQEVEGVLRKTPKYLIGKKFIGYKKLGDVPTGFIFKNFNKDQIKLLEKKEINFSQGPEKSFEVLKGYVKHHYVDIENDADIIASALYGKKGEADYPSPVFLISSDRHFSEAMEGLRKKYTDLKDRIIYVNHEEEKLVA